MNLIVWGKVDNDVIWHKGMPILHGMVLCWEQDYAYSFLSNIVKPSGNNYSGSSLKTERPRDEFRRGLFSFSPAPGLTDAKTFFFVSNLFTPDTTG